VMVRIRVALPVRRVAVGPGSDPVGTARARQFPERAT
jgi:hypothetical protein